MMFTYREMIYSIRKVLHTGLQLELYAWFRDCCRVRLHWMPSTAQPRYPDHVAGGD